MWNRQTLSLTQRFGPDRTAKLAVVYGEVLASLTQGQESRIPPRGVRMVVVTALLGEAERGECDPVRLKTAALSAIARDPELSPSQCA